MSTLGSTLSGVSRVSARSLSSKLAPSNLTSEENFVRISRDEYDQLLRQAIRVDDQSGDTGSAAGFGSSNKDQQFHRKLTRRVELPIEEEERVPVERKVVKAGTEKRTIKGTRLVPVQKVKEVEETVVEAQEETVHGYRMVWKQVKEPVTRVVKKPVLTTKVRKIPYTDYVPEEVTMEVEVPVETVETQKGYRLDKKVTSKVVDVEQDEIYEMRPHRVGVGEIRVKPSGKATQLGRTMYGREVYQGDDGAAADGPAGSGAARRVPVSRLVPHMSSYPPRASSAQELRGGGSKGRTFGGELKWKQLHTQATLPPDKLLPLRHTGPWDSRALKK